MAPARISSEYPGRGTPVVPNIPKDKTALEKDIRKHQLVPLWNTGAPPTAPNPHTKHIPAVWIFDETKKLLEQAVDLVPQHKAERRAVLMINPGPKQSPFTSDVLLAAHELITPGERAICHRHSPFAVRFLTDAEHGKGYTAISSHKVYMTPGDLIITPRFNWHDHGNEGETNIIWLDGLDIPLFKHYPIDFTEHYVDEHQTEYHASKESPDEYVRHMKFPVDRDAKCS
jgi:gentisate 1,2-dioxygenase